MKKIHLLFFLILVSANIQAQKDTIPSKLSFHADLRFRSEQDWNSRRSNNTYRQDRTRFRYRIRAGLTYDLNSWASFGTRIRTGYRAKQQDPHLTLGEGNEFGTLPLGFEQAYFKIEKEGYTFWVGKNTYPFRSQNELFWSSIIYPEGLFLKKRFQLQSKFISEVDLRGGYFLLSNNNALKDYGSYFQGFQISTTLLDNRITLFPSFYFFKNVPNIPDGFETFVFDYSILHLGTSVELVKKPLVKLEVDYYVNLQDYRRNDSIPTALKNQKQGLTTALRLGKYKDKGDWSFKATFTYLERYAVIDYLAQNHWGRWSYAANGSPDGRFSNFQGIGLVGGYMVDKNISLKLKYYSVVQLIPYGIAKETANRLILDLDVRF